MGLQVSSYERAQAVTKSDTTILDCQGFYVGGAGDVAIQTTRGTATGGGTADGAVTLVACIVGQIYPIACHRIMNTGTSASNIVALF